MSIFSRRLAQRARWWNFPAPVVPRGAIQLFTLKSPANSSIHFQNSFSTGGASRCERVCTPSRAFAAASTKDEHLFPSRPFLSDLGVSLNSLLKSIGLRLRYTQIAGLKTFPQMIHQGGDL